MIVTKSTWKAKRILSTPLHLGHHNVPALQLLHSSNIIININIWDMLFLIYLSTWCVDIEMFSLVAVLPLPPVPFVTSKGIVVWLMCNFHSEPPLQLDEIEKWTTADVRVITDEHHPVFRVPVLKYGWANGQLLLMSGDPSTLLYALPQLDNGKVLYTDHT